MKGKVLLPTRAMVQERRKDCAVLTVFDNSLPISIVRRQSGMISVDNKKLITSVSSTCNVQTGGVSSKG